GFRQRFLDQRLDAVEASVRWKREQQTAAAEIPMDPRDPRSLVRRLDASRNCRAAVRRIEERQLVRAEAEHRHAQRLEELERRRDVEQRLDPGRDDERLRASQLAEIRGHVRRMRKAAVHAAEPARAHEPDACSAAHRECPADRRRADRTLHDARRKIARSDLARACVEPRQLVLVEPDPDLTVEHADRRGDGARLAHPTLRLETDGAAFSCREAVCNQRRLERDDRRGLAYLFGDHNHGIAPSLPTQRAAASTASSGPPTRKPAAKASPAPVASTTSTEAAGNSTRSSPRTSTPRAPRLTTAVGASPYAAPTISHSASLAKITSGARRSSTSRKRTGPYSRIRVQAERSTLTLAPRSRASSAARSAAPSIGVEKSA